MRMDAVAAGAVTAVWHSDTAEAKRWFELIEEQHRRLAADGNQPDWTQFKQALAERASSAGFDGETVNEFVTYVETYSSSPVSVVAELANDRDGALQAYTSALEEATDTTPEVAPFDETAWKQYLAQWNGGWDGAEATWLGFKQGFLHYAPEGTAAAAAELIAYVESQPDKIQVLAQYGIGLAHKEVVAQPAAAADAMVERAADEIVDDADEEYDEELDLASWGDGEIEVLEEAASVMGASR
jgi:hypothetical protein